MGLVRRLFRLLVPWLFKDIMGILDLLISPDWLVTVSERFERIVSIWQRDPASCK